MSFIDCINRAVKDGAVSVQRGEDARQAYDSAYKKAVQDGHNEFDAAAMAARKATNRITDQVARKRVQRMMNMLALDDIMKRWREMPDDMDGASKLYGILEGDVRWTGVSFDSRYKTRLGQYHEAILQFIDEYRPKYAGIYSKKAGLDNFVYEMSGKSSGDVAAREFADSVKRGMELIVENANKAGADIETNERWWLPQKHSRAKMRNKKDIWIKKHVEHLDWTHTKWTDGSEILAEDRERFLSEAFDSIDSRGMKRDINSSAARGENMADRLSHGRVLYYKDAKSWLEINKEFGDGDPFEVLTEWIDSMARNTAMLETYGTSPSTTINYLKRVAEQDASLKQSALQSKGSIKGKSPVASIEDRLKGFDRTWELATLGNKASDENTFASVMSTTRNIVRSAVLSGSIFANVFGDKANTHRISMLNNVSAVKYLNYYTRLAASSTTRGEAVRAGLIAESATQRMISAARWGLAEDGARWSKYISDVSMRISLVNPHTQIAKWANGMMYMGEFADNAGKSFNDIPFKAAMERHGITSDEWDAIRKVSIHDKEGLNILRPNDIRKSGIVPDRQADIIADKFMDMVFSESKRAIIEATYRSRAVLGQSYTSGTLSGEVLRTVGEFKTFPVSITLALAQETLLKKTKASKIGWLGGFFLYMTIAGAASLQMNNIASGKDPQDMTDPKFWGAAALKGGSFGYLGDFIFADFNQYGESFSDMLTGPSLDFWWDIGQMTVGSAQKLIDGDDPQLANKAARFVTKYFPGSRMPIIRAAFEREITDQLMIATDPKAMQKFRKAEASLLKDKNQRRWWKKGTTEPQRAPDFSEVIQD